MLCFCCDKNSLGIILLFSPIVIFAENLALFLVLFEALDFYSVSTFLLVDLRFDFGFRPLLRPLDIGLTKPFLDMAETAIDCLADGDFISCFDLLVRLVLPELMDFVCQNSIEAFSRLFNGLNNVSLYTSLFDSSYQDTFGC